MNSCPNAFANSPGCAYRCAVSFEQSSAPAAVAYAVSVEKNDTVSPPRYAVTTSAGWFATVRPNSLPQRSIDPACAGSAVAAAALSCVVSLITLHPSGRSFGISTASSSSAFACSAVSADLVGEASGVLVALLLDPPPHAAAAMH